MKSQSITLIIIGLAITTFIGFLLFSNNSKPTPTTQTNPSQQAKDAGTYQDYSEATLADAHGRGDKVVLFFHANWCPTCRAFEREINRNPEQVPQDITILKLDYDTEDKSKAKYELTQQHALVQINESGEEITKWYGGGLAVLSANIK